MGMAEGVAARAVAVEILNGILGEGRLGSGQGESDRAPHQCKQIS